VTGAIGGYNCMLTVATDANTGTQDLSANYLRTAPSNAGVTKNAAPIRVLNACTLTVLTGLLLAGLAFAVLRHVRD
jgi:acyl-coenzyme A thioesterase PaaI-like protein